MLSSAAGAFAATGGVRAASTDEQSAEAGRWDRTTGSLSIVAELEFDSTSSLLNASGGLLRDRSIATVYAQPTATNEDSDSAGDATLYPDDVPIPLAAVDGAVAGFGSQLVTDGTNFRSGNEEFLLNVWDALIGGNSTVVYDESHDAFNTLFDFGNLSRYAAAQNSYTVTASNDLSADLSNADAVMISSPATAFTSTELSDLSSFVSNGGVVLLHDTADFDNRDETTNLNEVANALGVGFRFNDDQVIDFEDNGGLFFQPTTDEFNWGFPYFEDRPGMGIDPTTTYTVDVVDIPDGDTVNVRFDSGREVPIRVLGIDTPEKDSNDRFETIQEWEGLESETYLDTWGANASEFARTELGSRTLSISFDDEEPGIFDPFDRLLAYIDYDATGDGVRDDPYNVEAIRRGYARVYNSGFGRQASFRDAERTARSDNTGVWGQSDPANTTAIRNRDVGELFVPNAEAVRTTTGPIAASRVPVTAESEATQSGGFVSYESSVPLVGVDSATNVACVGGPLLDEGYEADEGFAVDTCTFENFVFLTNLIDSVSNTSGEVLIDGGRGQFAAEGGLSAESTAYYQRFLEGVGVTFDGINTLSATALADAKAVIVTPGPKSFTQTEIDNLRTFRDDGGAVILVGSTEASDEARDTLEFLAFALGSDLRLNGGTVTDGTNNVNGDSTIPTTTVFDTGFALFSAIDTGSSGGDGSTEGSIQVKTVNADAAGDDTTNLDDEYVVFENPDAADLDLTGYAVEDEVQKRYEFPDGFVLRGGATVTLRTGSGTDTDTDLYWGQSSPVWNNSGDTVFVFDDTGTQIVAYSY